MWFITDKSVIVCVWVVSEDNNRTKYSVKVPHNALPSDVIADTIRRRSRLMGMTKQHADRCIDEYRHLYVLKVCGCDQFLLEECAISQYKVTVFCLSYLMPADIYLSCKLLLQLIIVYMHKMTHK